MIGDILDDDKLYCELYKSKFLEKLTETFKFFRSVGDHSFEQNSTSIDLDSASGNAVYGLVFVGKVSGFYINFMIEESDGELSSIVHCPKLELIPSLPVDRSYEIPIFEDDLPHFKPNQEYFQRAVPVATYYVTVLGEFPQMINEELCDQWLTEFRIVHKPSLEDWGSYSISLKVIALVSELDRISEIYSGNRMAAKALQERRDMNKMSSVPNGWIDKYMRLYENLKDLSLNFFGPSFKGESVFRTSPHFNFVIRNSDFLDLYCFLEVFECLAANILLTNRQKLEIDESLHKKPT